MACKVWSHETVPVKIITDELSRDNQIRLALFLNSHRKRRLAFNVGDGEKYEDPIPVPPDDLESRLRHARSIIDLRISDDIAFTKIVSQRRSEFSADYEECVSSALQTARSLKAFAGLWDNEPPLPLAAAARLSRDTVWNLSLLQNSGRKEVLKK